MIKDVKLWLTIIIILSLFIVSSFFAQKYHSELEDYIQDAGTIQGSILYIILTIGTVIVAPVTILPLISVLANTWGSFYVGILTIIGESLGALLAFYIAKKYGRPMAGKLTSEKSRRLVIF